jgi:hypothetical protein
MDIIDYQTLLLQIIIILMAATITVGCILIYYFMRVSRDIEHQVHLMKSARHEKRREVQKEPIQPLLRQLEPEPELIPPVHEPVVIKEPEIIPAASNVILSKQDTEPDSARHIPPLSLDDIKIRYELSGITLSTEDGLLIGSSEPDQEEYAARYSQRYAETGEGWEDGAFIFSLIHKGSTVIGIAGSETMLPDAMRAALIRDVRALLSEMV